MQVNENSLSSEASARLPWSQATTTIGTTELVENRPSRCRCRCSCRQQNHCWKSTPALGSAGDGRNFKRQTSGWRLLLFEFQGKWQKNNFVFFKILTFKQKLGLPFMNMIISIIHDTPWFQSVESQPLGISRSQSTAGRESWRGFWIQTGDLISMT